MMDKAVATSELQILIVDPTHHYLCIIIFYSYMDCIYLYITCRATTHVEFRKNHKARIY